MHSLENTLSEADTLAVIGLDFDGCLWHASGDMWEVLEQERLSSNKPCSNAIEVKDFISDEIIWKYNPILANKVKEINQASNGAKFMCISNRQSPYSDIYAGAYIRKKDLSANQKISFQTGGGIIPLMKFGERLNLEMGDNKLVCDSFLAADMYNDLKPGTTFEWIKSQIDQPAKEIKPENFPYHFLFDESKILLAYLMIQRIATENPGKKIDFHMFDDSLDILISIQMFFTSYNLCLPENVKLFLYHYEGGIIRLQFQAVAGKGLVNTAYKDSVLNFGWIILKLQCEARGKNFDEIVNFYDQKQFFVCTLNSKDYFFDEKHQPKLGEDFRLEMPASVSIEDPASLILSDGNTLSPTQEDQADAEDSTLLDRKDFVQDLFCNYTKTISRGQIML